MNPRSLLIVDLESARATPDPQDVRQWAMSQSVFVSSLIKDLAVERASVRAAITDLAAHPVMFEDELGAQDVSAERAYLEGVATSSIYLGIYGERYGQPLASGYSATHEEFQLAEQLGKRMALFVRDSEVVVDGPQRDFVGGVRARYTTSPFANTDLLKQRVTARLNALATEELTPWVVIGDAAVRASQIEQTAERIVIRSVVRNARVAGMLERYASQRETAPYAGPHGSTAVRVDDVSSSSSSSVSRNVTLTLSPQDDRGGHGGMMFGSYNGVGSEQVFEQALRSSLLGEKPDRMSSFVRVDDPLASVRGLGLPESVIRPIARVLLAETLRRYGVRDGIERFVLGPKQPGGRIFELTWLPTQQYMNAPPLPARGINLKITGL